MSTNESPSRNQVGDGGTSEAICRGRSNGSPQSSVSVHRDTEFGTAGCYETCQEAVPSEIKVSLDVPILDTSCQNNSAVGTPGNTDDESSSDDISCAGSSQASLVDLINTPISSMKQLVERYFGSNGSYRPRYQYSQAVERRPVSKAVLNDTHVEMLTHDVLLHFLAPHEILALWRTSKTTWHGMVSKQRMFVMMRAVFGYLRISEEAAKHVDKLIIGGWNAYCPLLVLLCEHLARIYGNFEPDVAHRVFMAHQACFFPKSRGFWRCGSELAEHEVRLARVLDFHDRHVINYSQPTSKLPPPTLDVLKMDSLIGWGDAESYFEHEQVWLGHRSKYTAKRMDALEKHDSWMREHANEAPNAHYRMRLKRELSPCIWVDRSDGRIHLSPAIESNLELFALGIGSKRQQFLRSVSTRDTEDRPCSFAHCLEYEPSSGSCLRGGFLELILRRSTSTAFPQVNNEYHEESWPTLGILIWCTRQGLEPLADACIDWEAIINDVCRRDSLLFRRFYREGLVPWDPFGPHAPRPDPVDETFLEREKRFYLEALVSPLFGPADFRKYI